MKEIRTIKMVEQTEVKFVADDGTEFIGEYAENKCVEYERRKNRERVKNDFLKLKPVWVNVPAVDWSDGDMEIIYINVKDEIDFDVTIKDYFHSKSPQWMDLSCFGESKPESFPCEIVFVSGLEWVGIYGTKDMFKADLLKALEQLD